MKLSIVSPVYNASATLEQLVVRCKGSLPESFHTMEIILVDDGSADNSWQLIEELSIVHPEIQGIKLSRNFGQHYAIFAGLQHCSGDWVVVLDCDLQDRPEEITKLFNTTKAGAEIVLARRKVRQDKFMKRLLSFMFYKVLSWLTGVKQDPSVANFGIYSKRVISQIIQLNEQDKYFPTMVRWLGFERVFLDVEHAGREFGRSNYNFRKRLRLAIDIILSYSDRPLKLIVKTGFYIALISLFFIIKILVQWLGGDIEVLGYTSLMISIWFLSGCIMATLGIIGLYIGKIFHNVKSRPTFIVDKRTNAI